MRVDRSIERQFPKLAEWIRTEIPKCRNNARIWSAFLKYCQLDESAANMAIASNETAPTIDVAVMSSYGQYRPKRERNRNKIFIRRKLCREFDNLSDVDETHALIMKATILHEMIHWADFISDGQKQPNANIYDMVESRWVNNVDVGFQFESEAFYGIYTEEYL